MALPRRSCRVVTVNIPVAKDLVPIAGLTEPGSQALRCPIVDRRRGRFLHGCGFNGRWRNSSGRGDDSVGADGFQVSNGRRAAPQ